MEKMSASATSKEKKNTQNLFIENLPQKPYSHLSFLFKQYKRLTITNQTLLAILFFKFLTITK